MKTRNYFTIIEDTGRSTNKAKTSQQLNLLCDSTVGCTAHPVTLCRATKQRNPVGVYFGSRQRQRF